jgi:hypothetical protein
MVKYSCKNCQKTFTQKGHFEKHMSRKRPCKKDNTIEVLVEQKVKEVLSKINEDALKINFTTTTNIPQQIITTAEAVREAGLDINL